MPQIKIVSSLDKCLPGAKLGDFAPLEKISVLRGERLSFQCLTRGEPDEPHRSWLPPVVEGRLAELATVRKVDYIPSLMPHYPAPSLYDDGYISHEPGLYPDLLSPLGMDGQVAVCNFETRSFWVTVEIPEELDAGDYTLEVGVEAGEGRVTEKLTVSVIPATMPEQTLPVTQWFHCDCLADYYRVEVFSEEHWHIVENFLRVAVKNGINTLLTPIFTPPLDTAIGRERPTVQLVGVEVRDGEYFFDFSLLDRWIDMCDRFGIRYFEISHFFTQWGAAHAPKIMATVDGEYRRIFGWDTDAASGEYPRFLRTFIPAFISHMKERGDDRRCIFHISDEPNVKNIEQYSASRAVVADLLEDYMTMDALSNIDFWQNGVVKTPVVATNHIQPFIDANVPGLWAYYCCGQGVGVSNRFFAMPGARTRFIGMQLYKYNIAGFLQWGYNFYYNQGSYDFVDPYSDSTAEYFVPSGDAYSVYPGHDGDALESMRIVQFHEALQDLRALELCESLCGREATLTALEELCGEIVFSRCVCDTAGMLALREKINAMIADAVARQ